MVAWPHANGPIQQRLQCSAVACSITRPLDWRGDPPKPRICNCWLGTTSTSGDSGTRERCPVHGLAASSQDKLALKMEAVNEGTPIKPGYYWAKWRIPADGTHEGTEQCPSDTWEIVQVNANSVDWERDPMEDEALSVSVPGVRETQWRDCFVWGYFIAPIEFTQIEDATKQIKSLTTGIMVDRAEIERVRTQRDILAQRLKEAGLKYTP